VVVITKRDLRDERKKNNKEIQERREGGPVAHRMLVFGVNFSGGRETKVNRRLPKKQSYQESRSLDGWKLPVSWRVPTVQLPNARKSAIEPSTIHMILLSCPVFTLSILSDRGHNFFEIEVHLKACSPKRTSIITSRNLDYQQKGERERERDREWKKKY
jgi:hypothetical protein